MSQVTISGSINDSVTTSGIGHAAITAMCWRQIGSDDITYDKIDTFTDAEGRYRIIFDEGFKVDIVATSDFYFPSSKTVKLKRQSTSVSFKLVQNKNPQQLINIGKFPLTVSQNNNKKDKTDQTIGFDILGRVSSNIKEKSDIWITTALNSDNLILITHGQGGILPMYDLNNKSAPELGYFDSITIKGDERGFYVRCRDGLTYARLIKFSEYEQIGARKNRGFIFDYTINTSQGRDFRTVAKGQSLEEYLLDAF